LTGFGRQLRVLVIGGHDVGKSVIIRRLIGQGLVSEGAELSESASCNSLKGLKVGRQLYIYTTLLYISLHIRLACIGLR